MVSKILFFLCFERSAGLIRTINLQDFHKLTCCHLPWTPRVANVSSHSTLKECSDEDFFSRISTKHYLRFISSFFYKLHFPKPPLFPRYQERKLFFYFCFSLRLKLSIKKKSFIFRSFLGYQKESFSFPTFDRLKHGVLGNPS